MNYQVIFYQIILQALGVSIRIVSINNYSEMVLTLL